MPVPQGHAPIRKTTQGFGVCRYTSRSLTAAWRVPTPVTSSASACRGEPTSLMPNLSTSNFGVRQFTISMSQLLHAPTFTWKTHGDFFNDQIFQLIKNTFTASLFHKDCLRLPKQRRLPKLSRNIPRRTSLPGRFALAD